VIEPQPLPPKRFIIEKTITGKQKGDFSRERPPLPDFLKVWSGFQTTTKLFRNRSRPAS
jgi:hypothetical protein